MKKALLTLSILSAFTLTACDDGKDGSNGANGSNGNNGQNSLIAQSKIALGDDTCWLGGTLVSSGLDKNNNSKLDADEVTGTSKVCSSSTFPENGAALPYNVIPSNIKDSAGVSVQIRNGGFGSDAVADPNNPMRFYGLTDRGPNADYTSSIYAPNAKIFPVPDYTPRIGHFEVQADGSVKQLAEILLKDRTGKPVSGLPNPAGLGGTGEVAYGPDLKELTVDSTKPYDPVSNLTKTDPYGIDSEGLAALKDGTFWVSDEYGPHMAHYNGNGVEIERINPFAADTRNKFVLPNEFSYRRANRGMEGLTITPDQKTLVGIIQSTLIIPDKKVQNLDITRIVTVNLETGEIGQYLYKQELNGNSNCAIVALSATSFLVLERDGEFPSLNPNAFKRVYKIDLNNATNLEKVAASGDLKQDAQLGLTLAGKTLEQVVLDKGWAGLAAQNIVPVRKELVVDMVAKGKYPHDKMEGLWLIGGSRLGILNDDDFAMVNVNSISNPIVQKYLDAGKSRIDASTLYVVDGLDLSPSK